MLHLLTWFGGVLWGLVARSGHHRGSQSLQRWIVMASESRCSRREFAGRLSVGLGYLGLPSLLRAAPSGGGARPDIVLVMVDDMGFSDIGCYGGEVRTPTLDRLAANGLRFTQFYNTARCCPTRASLLTGLYPHQAGVGHMVGDSGSDGYRGDLSPHCVTIAQVLRQAGYGTYMSGKWHVTRHTGPEGPQGNWPCQRGFDRYYGTLNGAGSFYTPKTLMRDNRVIEAPAEGYYYTDAISENAVQFISEHARSRRTAPFFLYVAYTAPHWPLHAPKEVVDRYRGTYLKGWDALRAARHSRMGRLGIVNPAWALTPRDAAAEPWSDVPAEKKEEMDRRMAVYAAQIDCVDQGIGRIVAALEKAGRLRNTLILFLADNGGCAEGGPWGFERKAGGVVGEESSFASYGLSWANASNTPFRRYKHWVHEGGIATPLIVHWPERVADRGALRHQPGHVIDIMATCVDAARAAYPAQHEGRPIRPPEGKSLAPAFAGRSIDRDALFWEHEGNRAVRKGKWKLVSKHRGEWELYDLEADRTELNDLAGKAVGTVAELTGLYEAWAVRCGVKPWPVKRKRKSTGSAKAVFELKQGDELAPDAAPRVKGKAIHIEAVIEGKKDGVILGHGGSRVGYVLYVADGKLAMAISNRGKRTVVAASEPLPDGEVRVEGHLEAATLRVVADGRVLAEVRAAELLYDMPHEALQVGRDKEGVVGPYGGPNPFKGTIRRVTLRLGK